MKTYTGKTKNGAYYKGLYTNSGMPNQKPKRIRKEIEENDEQTFKFNFNLMGAMGSLIVGMAAPLPPEWKIGIIAMILIGSCQVEVQ